MVEVPVGFKWFVPGLIDGSFGFGGEESAGASFLRRDGCVNQRRGPPDPRPARRLGDAGAQRDHAKGNAGGSSGEAGDPAYARVDAPADREQKAKLAALSDDVTASSTWPARRSPTSSPTAPATAPRSAGSRSSPRVRGSPPGRAGPKTSTRSTPSPSAAPTIFAEVQAAARDVVSAALGSSSSDERPTSALGLLDVAGRRMDRADHRPRRPRSAR